MTIVRCNGHQIYYELEGEGLALVFVHGAFGDARIFEPQWNYFSSKYRVLRYDLRGHGRTGASDLKRYTMQIYADDLAALLDATKIASAVVCGVSWGGSIAQTFAIKYPARLKGLVLAGATVSMSLTYGEKLLRYVLFPRAAMRLAIGAMSVERFVNFSFWLARRTLGKEWLNENDSTLEYIRQCMLQIDRSETLKIWDAIYGFDLQPLETIRCPTLVLTGERDNKMAARHAQKLLRCIPGAQGRVLPAAYHAMTLEQPQAFNQAVEEFLEAHKV